MTHLLLGALVPLLFLVLSSASGHRYSTINTHSDTHAVCVLGGVGPWRWGQGTVLAFDVFSGLGIQERNPPPCLGIPFVHNWAWIGEAS